MNNSTPLREWLEVPGNTRSSLARQTGFTPDGITKMLKPHRTVYVSVSNEETELFENKKLISKKMKSRSAKQIQI